jgi:pilus assembly protein CpaC
MKPARSILPAVDPAIGEANGPRVTIVAGAARPDRSAEFRPSGDALSARGRRPATSAPPPKVSTRDRKMATATLIRISSLATLITTFGIVASGPIAASDQRPGAPNGAGMDVVGSDLNSRFVALGVGKSVVVDLPRDIKDVLIANPTIANAVIRSARRAYIIGATVGQTNIFFFDAEGRQIGGFDIAVKRDLNGIRDAVRQALPTSDIQVEAIGDGIMLTGNVATAAESQTAYDIAARLVGSGTNPITLDGARIVNAITVQGHDQVMLKVTVAEVKRTAIKQLGVNMSASFGSGATVLNFNNANPFPINGASNTNIVINGVTQPQAITGHFGSLSASLQALEQAGVVHTLAEPTLTAISGESATFIAGGKFPYPTPPNAVGGAAGFSWQTFGVSLAFTPVVLSEGRISLKILTEVSELAPENSVTIAGTTVPGITTRNVVTTLEIPSGGSLAMAGMIEEQTKQSIIGFPGLMSLPVLGALFKSRD